LLSFLLSAIGLPAQSSKAQLTGMIRDSSGAAVPSAEVVAIAVETGMRRTTVSNENGIDAIPLLNFSFGKGYTQGPDPNAPRADRGPSIASMLLGTNGGRSSYLDIRFGPASCPHPL
jgi:hypothetical protein